MSILLNTSIIFFVCLEALKVKYSVSAHEGSGQPQEAELIGSTQMSRRVCDQSAPPRASPSFHLLLIHVCLIVPAQSAVQFPLTI